jgi:hypothetical protein
MIPLACELPNQLARPCDAVTRECGSGLQPKRRCWDINLHCSKWSSAQVLRVEQRRVGMKTPCQATTATFNVGLGRLFDVDACVAMRACEHACECLCPQGTFHFCYGSLPSSIHPPTPLAPPPHDKADSKLLNHPPPKYSPTAKTTRRPSPSAALTIRLERWMPESLPVSHLGVVVPKLSTTEHSRNTAPEASRQGQEEKPQAIDTPARRSPTRCTIASRW